MSPSTHSIVVGLAARALEHRGGEVEPGDVPAFALGGDREVAGAAAGVEHAVARLHDRLDREPAPRPVEPDGHDAVHDVVHRRDAVEEAPHLVRRQDGARLVRHARERNRARGARRYSPPRLASRNVASFVRFSSPR